MDKTVAQMNVEFYNRIDDLDEDVERLIASSNLAYDEEFHKHIIKKYTAIINDVVESPLPKSDKFLLIERIKLIFEEIIENIA